MPPLAISILLFATVYHWVCVCACVCVCVPAHLLGYAPCNPAIAFTANYLWLRQTRTGSEHALPTSRLSIFYETLSAARGDAKRRAVMRCATTPQTTAGHWRRISIAIFSRGNRRLRSLFSVRCLVCLSDCLPGCLTAWLPVDIRLDEYLNCLYCWWISTGPRRLPARSWYGWKCCRVWRLLFLLLLLKRWLCAPC